MSPGRRVRVAKCQMLATCFLVVLLALCVATFVTVTYFGAHMAVIHQVSPGRNPYEESHRWAFYLGTGLAGILATGAVLSAAATVREAQGLMATGFLCFALAFCALVQVVLWRLHHPTQVEEAALDTFDLVYDRALRTTSGAWQRELAAIQDAATGACGASVSLSVLPAWGLGEQPHPPGPVPSSCAVGRGRLSASWNAQVPTIVTEPGHRERTAWRASGASCGHSRRWTSPCSAPPWPSRCLPVPSRTFQNGVSPLSNIPQQPHNVLYNTPRPQ
ncbi:tetraspanin-32 isoform X3 [Oryctolagus cuniculus]|uniref:tetraspanin-32 isoform X3 n=1 Tax=Oryctolagus cuniculus TaxID=9986 RepID=UPI00387A6E76